MRFFLCLNIKARLKHPDEAIRTRYQKCDHVCGPLVPKLFLWIKISYVYLYELLTLNVYYNESKILQ